MIVVEGKRVDQSTEEQAIPHRIPLRSRPADFVYVVFFLIHIPATLILDLQAIYPEWLLPADSSLRALGSLYMNMTNDPVIGNVSGVFGPQMQAHYLWLRCFMWTEMLLQLPTFIYGAYNLYHNTNITTLYPLLIAYGAGTAITTLPCVATLLTAPSASNNVEKIAGVLEPALTDGQRLLLLGSYIPFFLIPLFISIDMVCRTRKLAVAGLAASRRVQKWD